MDDSFQTLSGIGEAEIRVRGSRFRARAEPAEDESAARRVLDGQKRLYHDATHNCSAWRLRDGTWRADDAGEPSGSAGAPILAAIDGAEVADCIVVVTRYYGGTKLGVGGLIRAYGDVAARALEEAPRRTGVPAVRLRVRYPYELTAAVMRVVEQEAAQEVEHGYARGGREGEMVCTLPRQRQPSFTMALRDHSAGELAAERLESRVLYTPRRATGKEMGA